MRKTAPGVIDTTEDGNVDWVVTGWSGTCLQPPSLHRIAGVGFILNPVMQPPCSGCYILKKTIRQPDSSIVESLYIAMIQDGIIQPIQKLHSAPPQEIYYPEEPIASQRRELVFCGPLSKTDSF